MLRTLPPPPVVNDVMGIRGAMQAIDNWKNDMSTDPRSFDYFLDDFTAEVNASMGPYKGNLELVKGGKPGGNGGGGVPSAPEVPKGTPNGQKPRRGRKL